jgi:hypothetical protein
MSGNGSSMRSGTRPETRPGLAPGAATLAAAVQAVSAVAHEGRSADVALLEVESRPDRAAVRAITLGTLRWYLRLAPAVAQVVARPTDDLAPALRALLVTAAASLYETLRFISPLFILSIIIILITSSNLFLVSIGNSICLFNSVLYFIILIVFCIYSFYYILVVRKPVIVITGLILYLFDVFYSVY